MVLKLNGDGCDQTMFPIRVAHLEILITAVDLAGKIIKYKSFEVFKSVSDMDDLRSFIFDIITNGWCRSLIDDKAVFFPPHRIYEVSIVKIVSWEDHLKEMKERP